MENTNTFQQGKKKSNPKYVKKGYANGYTKADDEIILSTIKSYPNNLQESFRQSAIKLNRSERAISVHYYTVLRKNNKVITVGSKKGFTSNNIKNRQNKSVGQSIPLVSNLTHFHQIIINVLQLDAVEKENLKVFVNTIL